jgi:hypothetical protein
VEIKNTPADAEVFFEDYARFFFATFFFAAFFATFFFAMMIIFYSLSGCDHSDLLPLV